MASNCLSYSVDFVFCIDCTESMDNILNIVKHRAQQFHKDVHSVMEAKGKHVDQIRVRVVAFRDYLAFDDEAQKGAYRNEPMLVTDFFTLPQENRMLEVSIKSLQPTGGGDPPEDGLEALAYAIRSDWNRSGTKNRHVILLWTDQPPHTMGHGRSASKYPKGMAKTLGELSKWWGDYREPGYMPDQTAKRLILFAPDQGDWTYISRNWDNVVHVPSRAGDHLKQVDYETILAYIFQSIA